MVCVYNAFALINEPDTLVFGKIWKDGAQITAADTTISIEARLNAFGAPIATYTMGKLRHQGAFRRCLVYRL